MDTDPKIVEALSSNKVDSYLSMEAQRLLRDGLQPSEIWFPVVLRFKSSNPPPLLNEITRIDSIVAVSMTLDQLPDFVANPDVESIEASRDGGTL